MNNIYCKFLLWIEPLMNKLSKLLKNYYTAKESITPDTIVNFKGISKTRRKVFVKGNDVVFRDKNTDRIKRDFFSDGWVKEYAKKVHYEYHGKNYKNFPVFNEISEKEYQDHPFRNCLNIVNNISIKKSGE